MSYKQIKNHIMKRVRISFSGLTIPQKIEKTRVIVSKMTGNVAFATPNPDLAEINKIVNELETAYTAAQQGGKTLTATMYQKEKELDILITSLAGYVQSFSRGDEVLILSTGFDVVSKNPTNNEPLPAPLSLHVVNGVLERQLVLTWAKVKGAKNYVIQQANDPLTGGDDDFETIGTATKTKFTAINLQAGKKYWFRVAAIGTPGIGAFSDPANKMSL
jgi:predicted phage tail protein